MTNKEKYINIFKEIFGVDSSKLNDRFNKDTVSNWDSVHQLNLVNLAEETFDIMLDPEQIMDFTSFSKGIEILKSQGIDVNEPL